MNALDNETWEETPDTSGEELSRLVFDLWARQEISFRGALELLVIADPTIPRVRRMAQLLKVRTPDYLR